MVGIKAIALTSMTQNIRPGSFTCETMKYILALKDQPEAAQLALRVGIAVAKSDGNFDQDEKLASREIAIALGFDPAEFGL